MTVKEIFAEFQALSNEKMIALHTKNGAGKNQFGVKLGDIRNLANKIKTNHELALELWETKNIDAQLLACLIIDPAKLSAAALTKLVKSIELAQVADWVAANIIKVHPDKEQLQEKWVNSDNKWLARAGWSLTAGKIARNAGSVDIEQLLRRIEQEMPTVAPEIKWTMNTALAYTGIHHPQYRERAIAIGEKLGIYKDFPVSKGCTSPFAPIWINEMVSRQGK